MLLSTQQPLIMNPAKTGFLLLCAAAVAERTQLQAAAVMTGHIVSVHPLTVPPPLMLCSANHQEQQPETNSWNYSARQVICDKSGTPCGSLGADSGQIYKRRKCCDPTGSNVSCGEGIDGRVQSAALPGRTENTTAQMTRGSTAADARSNGFEANHIGSHTGNSEKGNRAGRVSSSTLSRLTGSLPSNDSGTQRGDAGNSTHSIGVWSYAERSSKHRSTTGSRRRMIFPTLKGERTLCSLPPSFAVSGHHGICVPESRIPPLPGAEACLDDSPHKRLRSSRCRATEGLDATTYSIATGCPVAENSTAAAAPPIYSASWAPQTRHLTALCSTRASTSAATPCQPALFPFACSLTFPPVLRTRLQGTPAASALQRVKGRRHVAFATPVQHSGPYQDKWPCLLRIKRTHLSRAVSTVDALVFSSSSFRFVSPAQGSFSGASFASHTSYPSFVSHCAATYRGLFALSCYSSSSHFPAPSSSDSSRVPASTVFLLNAASSLASKSRSSSSFRFHLGASSSAASSLAHVPSSTWFSSTARGSPDLDPSRSSFSGTFFARLLRSSSLGSLLSPLVPNGQSQQCEELKKKVEYIGALVKATPVVLFMKGTPTEPACGFSRMTYQLLELAASDVGEENVQLTAEDAETPSSPSAASASAPTPSRCRASSLSPSMLSDPTFFHYVNVMEDDLMRAGVKQYSEWPTIPQLYISGQFLGGADITAAMFKDKSLHAALRSALAAMERRSGPRQ